MNCQKEPTADNVSEPRETVGISLESPARVFISYRREDTAEAASHLHHSLEQQLGAEKVFHDVVTIQPGQDFEAVIDAAIRGTSVCLVLIGPSWLQKGPDGQRRLDSRNDYVRMEIESALRSQAEVIPVLADGAKMPDKKELPPSIAGLALRNGYELPWIAGITKLRIRIEQIEQQRKARDAAERAERERLDLTGGKSISPTAWRTNSALASFNVVVRTMEISLARQGHRVWLSAADLGKSYEARTNRSLEEGFYTPEILHIIDFVGVRARNSSRRYVARSYPVDTLEDIPAQLSLGRPVLVGVNVQNSWFKEPITKTGFVEFNPHDSMAGGVLGAVLGWDPEKQIVKLLSPWSSWGNRGMATLTRKAAEVYLAKEEMRSIEAALMPPTPFQSKKH